MSSFLYISARERQMPKQCPSSAHEQRRIQVGTVLLQRMYNRYPRPTCFMSIRRWIDSERHRPRTAAAATAAAAAAAVHVFTGKTIGTCETRTGQANTLTASPATAAARAGSAGSSDRVSSRGDNSSSVLSLRSPQPAIEMLEERQRSRLLRLGQRNEMR